MAMHAIATYGWITVPVRQIEGRPDSFAPEHPIKSCHVKFKVYQSGNENWLHITTEISISNVVLRYLTNNDCFITFDGGNLNLTGMNRLRMLSLMMSNDAPIRVKLDFAPDPKMPRISITR